MDASGAGRLNRSSPSCLNRSAQRIDFFHGLICLCCLAQQLLDAVPPKFTLAGSVLVESQRDLAVLQALFSAWCREVKGYVTHVSDELDLVGVQLMRVRGVPSGDGVAQGFAVADLKERLDQLVRVKQSGIDLMISRSRQRQHLDRCYPVADLASGFSQRTSSEPKVEVDGPHAGSMKVPRRVRWWRANHAGVAKAGIRMPCDRSSTWSRGGHGPQLGAARESTTIQTA